MNHEARYTIKTAARRTGLTTHVIRAWEKRYGAVNPDRTDTNRRVYSEDDISRLQMLKALTDLGYSISQIAELERSELEALLPPEQHTRPPEIPVKEIPAYEKTLEPGEFVALILDAVDRMDVPGVKSAIARATLMLSRPVFIEEVIVPLMESIGERWSDGRIRVAQEHMVSTIVRTVLGNFTIDRSANRSAPLMLIATPSGQYHEIGALLVAALAISNDWRVNYLGPDLPVSEMAAVAIRTKADVVGISIVYPLDDLSLIEGFRELRRYLPQSVEVIVGGRGATSYRRIIESTGGRIITSLSEFKNFLREYRTLKVDG